MGFEVCNQARFGSTIVTGRKIFDRHLYSIAEGDIVTLEFGGNDCDFPWKDIGGIRIFPNIRLRRFNHLPIHTAQSSIPAGRGAPCL